MKFTIISLFPEYFQSYLDMGIIKRALDDGFLEVELVNLRDYSLDKHKKADDYPFGEGPGMVLMAQPALDALEGRSHPRIHLSPRGELLDQAKVKALADNREITILCSHYEGLDQRVIDTAIDEEISIGDYILSGGEMAAVILMDAVIRLIPGVINKDSVEEESHEEGLLEYHQYTRPRVFRDLEVPEILFSGHHEKIRLYRLEESIRLTMKRRPDMIEKGLASGTYNEEVLKLIEKIREEERNEL
ncbi:MAG: tRNA (guanosine(37)-N1)-methyltransferase TrmD [Tissierellia bacterium]|nr:tRNA (guanosine(37)-N1)-methyltransferase TrmD [Tissierellia bacterium]